MNHNIDYQKVFWMSFSTRFLQLRKEHGLTQPQMADKVGIHLTQVRRYESGDAQPSLEILKRIAVTFSVSADWLIFEEHERGPSDDLALRFEAVSVMPDDERRVIKALLDGMILKYQAKQITERG